MENIDKNEITQVLIPTSFDENIWEHWWNVGPIHKSLGIAKPVNDWLKYQVSTHEFVENKEWRILTQDCVKPLRGRPSAIYEVTTNTALQICMASQGPNAKLLRQFFIDYYRENESGKLNNQQAAELQQQLIEVRGEIVTLKKQIQTMNANGFDPTIAPITMTTASKQIGTTLHILQSNIIYLLVSIIHQYTDKLRGLRIEYNVSNKERKPHPRLCFTQEGFEEVVEMLYSKKLITESQKEKAFQLITTTV